MNFLGKKKKITTSQTEFMQGVLCSDIFANLLVFKTQHEHSVIKILSWISVGFHRSAADGFAYDIT